MPLPFSQFGNISINEFLRDYWQKKPLLIRQALPDFMSPISSDELAGLAMEDWVESRLVLENGETPWELRTGPFTENELTALPDSHWTLLVQAVDQIAPEVSELLEYFRFLPNWRLDDIMISYATDKGGVGPHFDYYDVFLLQAEGKRIWKTGQHCNEYSKKLSGTSLNILADFNTEDEWVLLPGDMLYLPPQLAHWGIAEGECMTYSIGFRAPSHADIINDFTAEYASQLDNHKRFSDAGQRDLQNPGVITESDIKQVTEIIQQLANKPEKIAEWFGRYMTQQKYEPEPCPTTLAEEQAMQALLLNRLTSLEPGDPIFVKSLDSRLAFNQVSSSSANLYANGECYVTNIKVAEALTNATVFTAAECQRICLGTPDHIALLATLLAKNVFEFTE